MRRLPAAPTDRPSSSKIPVYHTACTGTAVPAAPFPSSRLLHRRPGRTSPRGWKQRLPQGAVPHARLGDRGALLTATRMPFKALFRQSNVHGGTHSF